MISTANIILGTAFFKKNFNYRDWINDAYQLGYRHFDTANRYMNESQLGIALKRFDRDTYLITSKIWPCDYFKDKCIKQIKDTLTRLDINYIDVMLLHKSNGRYLEAFKELIHGKEEGLIRYIGVSNFNIKQIEKIYETFHIYPDFNQIEVSPYYYDLDTIKYCHEHHILVQGYSPMGTKKMRNEPTLSILANKYHKSVSQIILRYVYQLGVTPIVKSSNIDHLKENLEIFDFTIDDIDMDKINRLKKKDHRYIHKISWMIDARLVHKP